MPPRQRQGGKKSKAKEGSSGSSEEGRGSKEKEESGGEEGRPGEQQRRRRKSGVSWTPVLKRLGIFVLIICIPAILNYAALNQEARMLIPAGGVLYDIGWNQKLMLKCTGQGLPTVILEAPVGQSSDVWVLVEPLIAKKTKVCVYDRAGLGFSDRAYQNTSLYANDFSEAAMDRDRTMPSTVERMADDLHRLISSSSNQPKPVLLVSLDFATLVSRFYTQLYEHEVAGLLLIDPAFEMLFDAMDDTADTGDNPSDDAPRPLTWHEYWYERIIPSANGVWLSAVIGFNRLSLMIGLTSPMEKPELVKLLPKEVVQRKKYLTCQPKHVQSIIYEYLYMNESMHQMKTVLKVKPFPEHLPVTIATYQQVQQSNLEPELSKVWMAGQDQLMKNIHPDSRHIVLPGSDYLTLFTHPRPVANAVLNMVDRWRRDSKLSA